MCTQCNIGNTIERQLIGTLPRVAVTGVRVAVPIGDRTSREGHAEPETRRPSARPRRHAVEPRGSTTRLPLVWLQEWLPAGGLVPARPGAPPLRQGVSPAASGRRPTGPRPRLNWKSGRRTAKTKHQRVGKRARRQVRSPRFLLSSHESPLTRRASSTRPTHQIP